MPIQVQCPKCGSAAQASDNMAGLTTPCPQCGTNIYVPGGGESSAGGGGGKVVAVVLAIVLGVLLLCGGGAGLLGWLVFARIRDVAVEMDRGMQRGMESATMEAVEDAASPASQHGKISRISEGIHAFHDVYAALPAHASYDADGKPLLSWRVHLLPFLGEQELYNQFHLDEPWDSEHNKQFVSRIPAIYQCGDDLAAEGKTGFVVPLGEGTAFPVAAGEDSIRAVSKVRLGSITDGLDQTILVLRFPPGHDVVWTMPEDWHYDPDQVERLFTGDEPLLIATGDGSVLLVSPSYSRENLKLMFGRDDGAPTELP